MNILIPHHWLLDHLDTKATPQQIHKYLSLCGPSVERIHKVGSESVYDIEVTTNRVDMMSVRGIAREAATILPEFKIKASLKPLPTPPSVKIKSVSGKKLSISNSQLRMNIVNNPSLCDRILAVKLSIPKVAPSPKWLQERLKQVGQRPLNNIIDLTNYLMWELGHPMHAFDYDLIHQHQNIIVTEAKKGAKLTTLDGITHTLKGGEVVFEDGSGTIIDLPGIMGTANTVVSDHTQNILLWIESVKAKYIRKASMGLAIRTQAATLNEKHVDPYLGKEAILQAIGSYQLVTDAKVDSELIDIFPNQPKIHTTNLTQDKLNIYLGIHVPEKRVERILTHLGCNVTTTQTTSNSSQLKAVSYQITPPSSRAHDLKIPEDYIEEIARIYGYHNLKSIVMPTPIPDTPPHEDFTKEHHLKELLSGFGLQEVYTYSMVSQNLAQQSGHPIKDHLRLKNPLSDDWVYLRRTLIPSHLEVIAQNKNHQEISIFELANTYTPQKSKLPSELLHLTITTTGDYRHLKGILDALAQKLFIDSLTVTPATKSTPVPFLNDRTGIINLGKRQIGHIGQVNTNPAIYAIELPAYELLDHSTTHPDYTPISTTTPIIEDLTFTLPKQTHISPVIEIIKSSHQLITSVTLKTIYHHNYTFTVSYQDPDIQLSATDITPVRKTLVNKLRSTFKAPLVGQI